MKKVEAIIRPHAFPRVMRALRRLGYPGVTVSEVRGHGKQKGYACLWRGSEYHIEFLPKVKVEVVVLEEDTAKVVNAVMRAARSGKEGDGKIFVYQVDDAVRIRTGEGGVNAV